MALYRCVGVDNPGPQRTNKYVRVVTANTGGSTASVRLQYYDNGVMLQEVNIQYSTVLGRENGYNFRDMVKLWYNSGNTSWVLDAIEDCVYSNSLLVAGDVIYTWGYGNTIDFNVYEIVLEPTKTPILVSTGQQYITLPIYKDENDILKIRFRVKTLDSEKCIMGSGWEIAEYLFHPYVSDGNPIYRYFTSQRTNIDGPRNTRLGGLDTYDEVELGYGYLIVNGERYEQLATQNTGHTPIYMFGVASSGTGQHLINMAITEVKIYKNDVLTYDLVPHKKDNGDGCFIDVLNGNTEYASETQTPLIYDEIGGTCESFLIPNKYWFGTLADYNALTTYDEQTVYNIQPSYNQRHSSNRDANFTQKIYIGANQVFPQVKEGWDYYIENLTFPDTLPSGKIAVDLGILTDIDLESTANYQRNWQLEFNCEYSQTATINGDQVVFGCRSASYSLMEVYFNPSGQLCLYANGVGDDDYLNDAIGNDIKLIFRGDGTGLEIYKNGVYQSTVSAYRQSEYSGDARNYMSIGQWSADKTYYFHGTIHYLKFKWLD